MSRATIQYNTTELKDCNGWLLLEMFSMTVLNLSEVQTLGHVFFSIEANTSTRSLHNCRWNQLFPNIFLKVPLGFFTYPNISFMD